MNFTNLYLKQTEDETLTPFQNEIGFSLVRLYPKNTPYHKDNKRMFIRVALLDRGLFYGVDMTRLEKKDEQTNYILTDGEEYKKRTTNFFSDTDGKEFVFNETLKKFIHVPTGKEFNFNEFVELLVKNHLSDRLFWKRKINACISVILKFLFWLADKHYEKVRVSIDKYRFGRDNKPVIDEQKNVEPFFKYFYISKNFIFAILLTLFIFAILVSIFPKQIPLRCFWHLLFGEFTLSNPMVVLLIFLVLFTSEKISVQLNKSINDFLIPNQNVFSKQKENFIERLHNYQYHNKFNLKIL